MRAGVAGDRSVHSDRLTEIRREVKFRLDSAQAKTVLRHAKRRLSVTDTPPDASGYRISIYLDTPTYRFSNAELMGITPSHKLRIRDYYYAMNGNTVCSSHCFLEAKIRNGNTVRKLRRPLERTRLWTLLCRPSSAILSTDFAPCPEIFAQMDVNTHLLPLFLVHYRRIALQDDEARLRVTFDSRLAYHPITPCSFNNTINWCPDTLPPPFLQEPMWIVEVKSAEDPPAWINDLLPADYAVAYSKFGAGLRRSDSSTAR